jgi:predicted RNase H-like HicB family nuclease
MLPCVRKFDIASQGETIEKAKANLKEAVSLFVECAANEEVEGKIIKKS